MYGAFINFPSDFASQVFSVMWVVLKMLSPFLIPVIGVLIFANVVAVIIGKIKQPGQNIIKRRILAGLLVSATSAFLIWLSQQQPEFQQGFMLVPQFFYELITTNKALTTLVTTLIGIAGTVLLWF